MGSTWAPLFDTEDRTPPMTAPRKILALAPLAALALATSPARAQEPAAPLRELGVHLDADLDLGAPMGYVESRLSFGAGGRLGWRFDLGPVWLQPEAGGHYTVFTRWSPDVLPCDDCKFRLTEHPVRVLGGLRLGGAGLVAGVIEPALFGHAGYGWDRSGTPSLVTAEGTTLPRIVDRRGPAFDVGFAFDVKIVRTLRFGLHAAYNVVVGSPPSYPPGRSQDAVRWLSYGLHAGVAR